MTAKKRTITCQDCGKEFARLKLYLDYKKNCEQCKAKENKAKEAIVEEKPFEPNEEIEVLEPITDVVEVEPAPEADTTLELNTEDFPEVEPVESKPSLLSKEGIMKAIKSALKMDAITPQQARQMRAEHGIFKSEFTKKRNSARIRKQKRKAQRLARRVTRRHGSKGQKTSSKYRKA